MTLDVSVSFDVKLYQKETLNKFVIKKEIEAIYSEESEEYKSLVEDYKSEIGFDREEDADKFDKMLLTILQEQIKVELRNSINQISKVFKDTKLHNKNGVAEIRSSEQK